MKTNDVWKRARRIPVNADHRRALRRSCRRICRAALPSGADFCGRLACKDSFLYERKSISMCGVVFDFGSACMDCGKTGEVGTDDLRKRDPQVEGEIAGRLSQNWKRVLPAKFAGGFLCMLGGLSLGREGPSIQLGAMAGQGISRALGRGKREDEVLMTCGRVRTFCCFPCTAGRYDVCGRRDP